MRLDQYETQMPQNLILHISSAGKYVVRKDFYNDDARVEELLLYRICNLPDPTPAPPSEYLVMSFRLKHISKPESENVELTIETCAVFFTNNNAAWDSTFHQLAISHFLNCESGKLHH